MVATSIVFFPAAPFFLFMHGKEISIPKGTEITAYVNGNMHLDARNFVPGATLANSKTRARGKENASQIGIYVSQEKLSSLNTHYARLRVRKSFPKK